MLPCMVYSWRNPVLAGAGDRFSVKADLSRFHKKTRIELAFQRNKLLGGEESLILIVIEDFCCNILIITQPLLIPDNPGLLKI